ncbi:MAG: sigma-70 family RNA polymerase sigma factor [Deltaproteobacteria bacterium]|nr:sigma-70 family RNA polymerase sigma factor [Deltaproteobacteria bacterium]
METDREALRDLYQRYASRVYQRCRYLLRNDEDARDAMHDVFIKVLANLEGFRGQASPLTWITRISTNHCLNLLRSRRAAWREELREMARVAEQARESEHATIERLDLLHAILARCDAGLQELAVYYFVDEMTQDEIAGMVGLSVPTLRKRLRQFMRLARRELTRAMPGVQLKEAAI